MGSNSIPPKTLSDENINRGVVCAYMHFIARTQKTLTFLSQTGECRQQKHTQHAPSTKTECDYLNGWTKKTVTYANISPESGEPKRYSWGTKKKKTNKPKNNNNKQKNPKQTKNKTNTKREMLKRFSFTRSFPRHKRGNSNAVGSKEYAMNAVVAAVVHCLYNIPATR